MKKKLFSLAFSLLFILNSIISQSISKFEYFIDADPGVGSGVSFLPAVSDSVTVTIPVSITGIPVGSHTLGVRSMDVNGVWSHAEFRTFFINSLADNNNQQLVMAEFYLGETDPGVGLAFPVLVSNPADSVSIIADTVLNNLPIGQYKINVRFKDGRGVWSHQETRIFSICSTYGAQSEMNYQIEGNKVFFTSNSLYYDTISWRFGDNTFDTVTNPIKTYTNAGVYNVQLITGNSCGIDTLPTSIEIRGLQRISPPRTGNGGVTTVSFNGFGFLPGTEVKLIKDATVLTPIQKYFHSSGNITAYFNLTSQSTGMYHAVAVLGSAFDTLFNALQVENPDPVIVSVSISGPKASRVQTMRRYSNIFNYSNQDAIMVPYASEIGKAPQLSYTVQYDTFADMLFLNNKGIFQNTYQYLSANSIPLEVMEAKDIDTVRKKELLAYYKIRIPAASYATDMIKIANNTSITYSHGALVQPPLFTSSIVADSLQSDFRVCMNSFLKKAVKKNLAVVINDAAWNSCFDNAFDTLARTIRDIAKQLVFQKQSIPMKAVYAALLSEISLCGTSGLPSSLDGNIFKQIVKDVTYNWLFFEDLDSLGGPCFDTTMTLTSNRSNMECK